MKDDTIIPNSGFVFWGIILVSFICLGIVAELLNGCSGECATNLVKIVQSSPAENSFYQIDVTNPGQSFLPVWQNYGL